MTSSVQDAAAAQSEKLEKSLKLFDVYAMATGAMFSSGLFLLPGIAAASTGNSVWLAYICAGLLILPAMFCMAELSTAMPKAGGTYFFLDRSLGPMVGTIGGLGSWVAVVFKSAFALVGMGAYLALYIDLPFTVTAVILTILFGAVNWIGAKETTSLQRVLVTVLVVILTAFVVLGLVFVGPERVVRPDQAYGPYFSDGFAGFIATIGLVFVSYAGLTKVASVAGEVESPDRNIPLGMTLALITATVIYALATLVLVTVLPPQELFESLTPVADAGEQFLSWMPYDFGVILIVVSAVAAFASTGNAGIMSASRYPFAMAKDGLLPDVLATVGRFGTPSISILATVLAMIAVLVAFDVESVAKLASAFQLLLFGMVCVAVIIMREAQIDTYKPGFAAPLYPWVPALGIVVAFWLILQMGPLALAFTGVLTLGCFFWYEFYARGEVRRRGAIFHVAERVGRQRYEGIERELMGIVRERTEESNISYESTVAGAAMFDLHEGAFGLDELVDMMVERAGQREDLDSAAIREHFEARDIVFQRLGDDVSISFTIFETLDRPVLFVFRFCEEAALELSAAEDVHSVMFLLTPPEPAGLELRLVGQLAELVQEDGFLERWRAASDATEMSEILMRDDHFIFAPAKDLPSLADQIGQKIRDVDLPESCLIITLKRDDKTLLASPKQVLREGDLLGIVGEPEDLDRLRRGEVDAPVA